MIIVFVSSYNIIFSVFGSSIGSFLVEPYFFIFLYEISLPVQVGLFWFLLVMLALYVFFFVYIIYASSRQGNFKSLDSPIGYFVFISCASLLLSVLIILLENGLGIQIGGTGIETAAEQNPLLTYTSLIYAPFVEEIGFRIIPLGILSAVLVGLKIRSQDHDAPVLSDCVKAIVNPGSVRKKHGIKFTRIDWILIIVTSVIFAYAHIYFGGWDWGKFAQTFVFGMFVAVGFLKFGAYVDIPMHWVANGISGLVLLDSNTQVVIGAFLLWLLAIGVVGVALMIIYASDRSETRASPG